MAITPERTSLETRETPLRETIQLPNEPELFIHVETNSERMTKAFGKFAVNFEIPEQEAETFFREKVVVGFGKTTAVTNENLSSVDKNLTAFVAKVKGIRAIAQVVAQKEHISLRIDVELIAKLFKILQTESIGSEGYDEMSQEQRIMAFEQILQSVTEHEFFHLVQCMQDIDKFKKAIRAGAKQSTIVTAFALGSIADSVAFPRESVPHVVIAGAVIIGFIVRTNRAHSWLEKDAYEAQKKARDFKLDSPYSFVHENG
ncbi:MAG: hypothetical protein ABI758_06540 [Candidatus Woesebacteria bacterium]